MNLYEASRMDGRDVLDMANRIRNMEELIEKGNHAINENCKLRQRICELEEQQSTLTEQLRLANEDAERLYQELKVLEWHDIDEYGDRSCPRCFTENPDHEDDCAILSVLRLHKERIVKER